MIVTPPTRNARAAPARAARAATLALAVALGAGCMSDEATVERNLAQAEEHAEAGEHREALILLKEALHLEPDNARINLEIAESLEELDRRRDAGFYYGEAHRLDPSLTEAALAHAPLLYESDPEQAHALVEDVIEREPDNHLAYLRRAELALLDSDSEAAMAAALTARELAPDQPESHRIVGAVYRAKIREERLRGRKPDTEHFEAALASFQQANELRGESWFDWLDVAQLHGGWPDHEEQAKEAWRNAFAAAQEDEDEPGMRKVASTALSWSIRKRDREFARWALRRRLDVDADRVQGWQQLAELAEAEEAGAGEEIWKQALEEQPAEPRIHTGYAGYLASGDRTGDAITHLESLPPEVGASQEVDLLLTKLYTHEDRFEEARGSLARMRDREPGDPRNEFAAAQIAAGEGRMEDAAQALRTVADELDRADLFQLLTRVETARGNPEAALAAANRAMEASPRPTRALYRLRHRAQTAAGDWEGLVRSLREMRGSGMGFRLLEARQLVRAQYELGRQEQARRILDRLLDRDEPDAAAVLTFVRYEGSRQPDRARELLQGLVDRYGPTDLLMRSLAELELVNDRPEKALEHIASLGPPEELGMLARLLRARTFIRLERLEEAEADVRAVLASDKRAPDQAAPMLADILRARGQLDEAIAILESAREEGTLTARHLWGLGRMYMAQGNLDRARVVLEEAVGAGPTLYQAHNDLAYVLAETRGDLDRALVLARQARAALPDSPAVTDTLGWVYYRRGMLEPALHEFRAALTQLPEGQSALRADLNYHLALALRDLGRTEEALEVVDQVLALEPEHEGAREVRARLVATGPEAGG